MLIQIGVLLISSKKNTSSKSSNEFTMITTQKMVGVSTLGRLGQQKYFDHFVKWTQAGSYAKTPRPVVGFGSEGDEESNDGWLRVRLG